MAATVAAASQTKNKNTPLHLSAKSVSKQSPLARPTRGLKKHTKTSKIETKFSVFTVFQIHFFLNSSVFLIESALSTYPLQISLPLLPAPLNKQTLAPPPPLSPCHGNGSSTRLNITSTRSNSSTTKGFDDGENSHFPPCLMESGRPPI